MDEIIFDKIYIGSGPVMMLDAFNSNLKNEKILILDKSNNLGGAWKNIDLFGVGDLENAVHYLLPNKKAYDFLENQLKVRLNLCKSKFYAFNFLNKYFLLSAESYLARLIYLLDSSFRKKNFLEFFSRIWGSKTTSTKYPEKGCKEFVNKIIKLVTDSEINLDLKSKVKVIEIYNQKVHVTLTNNKQYISKNLVISSGFIPPNKFLINKKQINLIRRRFRRPSLHICTPIDKLTKQKRIKNYSQILFPEGDLIKYVHYLNNYCDTSSNTQNNHIVVCALKHDLEKSKSNMLKVVKQLETFNLIPHQEFRFMKNFHWQEIYLPMLSLDDLCFLENESKGIIQIMFTESLSGALGKYVDNWLHLKNELKKNL